ncbi:MAG: metallophosphoesterase [Pseudomonadota bacterium]
MTLPVRAEFSFVAIGDTAYNGARDYPLYEQLIDRINSRAPEFTIHVGDLWGAGSCGDEEMDRAAEFFARYDHPLVYTPGDNEWTDCWVEGLGRFDPLERLAELRTRFFSIADSLGKTPMPLVRQADLVKDDSEAKALVENARWEHERVLFMTVHVPGSQNGADHSRLDLMQEFMARNQANVAWINDGFRLAIQQELPAVVIALHAELFASNQHRRGPFGAVLQALREGSERFGKPVLLIHGDFHQFVIDRPFFQSRGEEEMPRYANLTRLQVHGAPELAAVRVTVKPETIGVFGFEPVH